jgi:hypothetical protein
LVSKNLEWAYEWKPPCLSPFHLSFLGLSSQFYSYNFRPHQNVWSHQLGRRSNHGELACGGVVCHPLPSHYLWGNFRGHTCRNHLQPVGSSYCLSLFGPWAIPPCAILFTSHWCLKKRKAIWLLSLSTFRKKLIFLKFSQSIIRTRSQPFNRSHTTRLW